MVDSAIENPKVKITNITPKKKFMIYLNQLEVMLFPKYFHNDLHQKELLMWLGTTARPAISRQTEKAKKLNLRTFKGIPAIYLS